MLVYARAGLEKSDDNSASAGEVNARMKERIQADNVAWERDGEVYDKR